jgi:hypothetical protein
VFGNNYIISVRNVGYVRSAGRIVKDAFAGIGSAGGHSSMAKAIIPLAKIAKVWGIESRNVRSNQCEGSAGVSAGAARSEVGRGR